MTNRQTRVPDRVLFTSLLLAALVLLFAPRSLTSKFQFAFVRIFGWPLHLGTDASLSVSGLMASAQASPGELVSREKYDTLHNRLANVTEWLRQEREQVERLSGLRARPAWKGVSFVVADVVVAEASASHRELTVNRGAEDGLTLGQFVLSDESVVGTICAVDSRTARVRLITDAESKMAVKIEGSNADRIMQGDGRRSAKVLLVPTSQKVETGALIYAQKKPAFLGTPVIVGTVSECTSNKENPLLWDITVTPACDIEHLTDVAVIVMNPL
ncbi:MAG TPA: rod shape-determining protein MreC [Sedimentisphaerales bacterium]|nr:rod shape-determining protein MreC [Sedimentisphaerales bacterium]